MTYDPRDVDEVRDPADTYLENQFTDPALDDVDILGALVAATATTIAEQQEQTLEDIDRDSKLQTATGDALTTKAEELGVRRREAVRATGVVEFSRSSSATTDYTIASGTRVQTADGSVTFETTEQVTLANGTSSVKANARAVEGGTQGNLPANKLTSMPSPPTGVEDVTNPNPTGDEAYTDTDGNTLTPGLDRETDEELRERTFESNSIGGAATPGAVETALRDVDGVRSVTLFVNPDDSTDANGLPPYSSEVVVTGGNDTEIARTLRDTVAVTELYRLQSGTIANGQTITLYVDAADEDVDIDFSRATTIDLNIDIGIVTTNDYIGDTTVADRMVDYVGGTDSNNDNILGLGAGENVVQQRLEDQIVGEDTGVQGVTSMTFNNNSTTTVNGLEVIEIAKSEQALLDASNVTISQV